MFCKRLAGYLAKSFQSRFFRYLFHEHIIFCLFIKAFWTQSVIVQIFIAFNYTQIPRLDCCHGNRFSTASNFPAKRLGKNGRIGGKIWKNLHSVSPGNFFGKKFNGTPFETFLIAKNFQKGVFKTRNDEMVEMLDPCLFLRFLFVLIISVFQKENNFWTSYISFRHFVF